MGTKKSWANAVETDLGRGTFVPAAADRRRTLAELIDKFELEHLPIRRNKADNRMMKTHLAWWKDRAGHVTLDKLTAKTIAGYRSELLARKTVRTVDGEAREVPITQATANRYLAALSAVCKWAWKELGWLPANPVLSVTKGAEHTGIVRYLDDDERKALLAACKASDNPNIATAVALALATGAPASNIRNLTWADVDLEHWRLRFAQRKDNQPRFVPLVGPAQAILQAHFERDPTQKGWVFKGGRDDVPGDLDRPWRAVRKAARLVGEKHCRFHDLLQPVFWTINPSVQVQVRECGFCR